MERLYTIPRISKGKLITKAPKGSSIAKEQAKQDWYIEYNHVDPHNGKMKRFRTTEGGNRIKNHIEKEQHFNALLNAYTTLLQDGWNPFDEVNNERLKKSVVSIALADAVEQFKQYHYTIGSREKSIRTYMSKLKYLIAYFGGSKKVVDITDYDVMVFLNHHEREHQWSGNTYNLARIIVHNLFEYLKKHKYVEANPVVEVESRKRVLTQMHQVFTDEDLMTVLNWLKANDPYCLLFVRIIYYTCIRPKELRQLQLKHIDLKNAIITIPGSISKNKKSLSVSIDESLHVELNKLELHRYPDDYYLLSNSKTIVGKKQIGENTPYWRFQKCLKLTKLLDKGYTLYSIKHLSNKKRYLAGWTTAEIALANRHSSLIETETYLKDLMRQTQVSKSVPPM